MHSSLHSSLRNHAVGGASPLHPLLHSQLLTKHLPAGHASRQLATGGHIPLHLRHKRVLGRVYGRVYLRCCRCMHTVPRGLQGDTAAVTTAFAVPTT